MKTWVEKVLIIQQLEKDGVLGPELCPEADFWHWKVKKLDELPEWLKPFYNNITNEICW